LELQQNDKAGNGNYHHFDKLNASQRRILISLIIIAVLIRLWAAWQTNQRLPDTPERLVGDEPGYDGLATALLNGYFFQWPGRTPVYPIFLAAIYAVFGHSYATVLYVQAFVGSASVLLTFLLARRFTTSHWALFAAAIISMHPSLILHVTRIYSEIIYTPLLLLSILGLLGAMETADWRRFVLGGAILAVTNLCRPTAVLLPLIIPVLVPRVWAWKTRLSVTAVYTGAMIAVIAPWTYHNYRTYDTFLPLSVSTAILWQGSPEFYHLMEARHNLLQIWQEELNPKVNGGHDPFTIAGDHYFTARAIESIKAEPGIYVKFVFQKMIYFWVGNPVIDWPYFAMFSFSAMRLYFPTYYVIAIIGTRLLPLVALVSLALLRHELRPFFPLLTICIYFMMIHALTYPEIRYSEPLHPVLATIIAGAANTSTRNYLSSSTLS
jgi:4-amino-4-deoxy-L-arabinose transferase-like glycosyltransferase